MVNSHFKNQATAKSHFNFLPVWYSFSGPVIVIVPIIPVTSVETGIWKCRDPILIPIIRIRTGKYQIPTILSILLSVTILFFHLIQIISGKMSTMTGLKSLIRLTSSFTPVILFSIIRYRGKF